MTPGDFNMRADRVIFTGDFFWSLGSEVSGAAAWVGPLCVITALLRYRALE